MKPYRTASTANPAHDETLARSPSREESLIYLACFALGVGGILHALVSREASGATAGAVLLASWSARALHRQLRGRAR